jgi:hypothetical protein
MLTAKQDFGEYGFAQANRRVNRNRPKAGGAQVAQTAIPVTRSALEPLLRRAPLRLPRSQTRAACRPVIGDDLLLPYVLQKRSVRYMPELTIRQAREMLTAWAAEQHDVTARRDQVIREAVAAGVSKSEVHRLTGIARTTIDRIVDAAPAGGEGAPK